ncbi:ABC transporter substrate-binding protein [Lederbergia wuyishanensis]|uniref:Lactose/L-arabinose transport system substrate-binding protein n=1 Tax=Lederbergia wuyishanensis TaxID=1347903 RepID=A0ABU0D6N8_9BACI|nr:extracellular solute-binding protein [Lederbergia wuyishanensis]MCJ8008757.1 extracellular solute-binding protein [Lederbergia wuyishanensis]MDQ0344077.1 lactose/L-arabinose transport system substrate-binding protein [Lederbergia wuyishanensis]
MKKIFLLMLTTMFIVTACSTGSSDKGGTQNTNNKGTNEITAWAWDPKFNIAALKLAEANYTGDKDFKLKVIENGQPDIVQKLNTGLSSGTMKGMPNIVLIEDYRAQSFLQAYPDAFYEISDYFNTKDFADYKIAPTSFNGKQYGLPFDTGVTGLYVRTDMLKDAGLTVEDVRNIDWDQFIKIGKTIRDKTGKGFLTLDPNDLGTIRMMIQSAGSWYLKNDGVTPNLAGNEALKEAFRIYKTLLDEKVAVTTSDWSQFLAAFNNGDIAGVPTGNWITPSIKAETSQSGKWAVVPIPRLPIQGAVNASNLGGSSFYVLNIDGKEKAADFLGKTFGSNKDFYQKLVKEVGALGTYKPATEGEAYKSGDDFFGGQKVIQDFSKWMAEIPGVNYGIHTYAIEDILIAEMQNYLNGKDIDDVMNDAQQQAEAQLK